jgi:thiol-disulfide isomerase/thioredoxin
MIHSIKSSTMQTLANFFFNLSKILIFISFLCCTSHSQERHTSKTTTESKDVGKENGIIHIRFVDNPVFNSKLITKTKKSTGRLDYIAIYDNFEREGFRFHDIEKTKTAKYSTESGRVIVRRYLSFFEFQDFLVHKGDSIVISFDQSKPVVIKHSITKYASQDLNVESIINKKIPGAYLTAGMADDTRMAAFKYFYDDPKESERQLARDGYEKGLYLEDLENKMGSDLLLLTRKMNVSSQRILDSLYNQKQISDNVYNFYKQKYSNLLLKLEILSGSKDSTQAAIELNSRYKKQSYQDVYFNQCLDNFEKKYITSKAKWTLLNQSSIRDPKESFTIATKSSLLNSAVKDQMLFISLSKIDNYLPDETYDYLNLFANSVTDTTLGQKARAKYQKDKLLNTAPSNLHLLTYNREQITIEELLARKSGKIIYLDFWASWCAPCVEEMPHSKSLLRDYEKKGLEVVFFSLDDTYMKWSKASERLEINLTMNSFKILSPNNSKFLLDHKLQTIPRYMVIDKSGKVINGNAPHPSDPKIRKLFDELLGK